MGRRRGKKEEEEEGKDLKFGKETDKAHQTLLVESNATLQMEGLKSRIWPYYLFQEFVVKGGILSKLRVKADRLD